MNLKEIDLALETWQRELPRMVSNQLELEEQETYHLAKLTSFVGKTRERVVADLETATRNWGHLKLLEGAIKRAVEARGKVPAFGQGKAIAKIVELLTGPSIELPAVPVPFEQRSLTSESEIVPTITPGELKKQAIAAFDAAKSAIRLLKESWEILETIAAGVDGELARLQKQAAGFGSDAVTALAAKVRAFHHMRKADPLAFTLESNERLWPEAAVRASVDVFLGPELDRARRGVEALLGEREAIVARIRAAPGQLDHLRRRREKALQLHQESQTELKSTEGLRVPPSLKELTAQLEDLDEALAAKEWSKVTLGIETWLNIFESVQAATEEAVKANRARLGRLKELRSRWMAARQRREECEKFGPLVDKALDRFGQRVELLTTVEVDLDQAEQMIYSYETRLGELINRMRK